MSDENPDEYDENPRCLPSTLSVEITATERVEFDLYREDLEDIIAEHGELTIENIRAKIVDLFEQPDFSLRDAASYDVRFDYTDPALNVRPTEWD